MPACQCLALFAVRPHSVSVIFTQLKSSAAPAGFLSMSQTTSQRDPTENVPAQPGNVPAGSLEQTPTNANGQQHAGEVPPARPTGTLQDMDTNELNEKRNQILWDQAVKGQQPGATLMQDRLSGENKQETWGNEPTIMEPENEN
eukprot:GHRR01026184.1.p1 GENE.GHRR01026184.1~~GHRR01026184.1.p1  ORF type:complete len:144 (-),score=28.95 GHRR01026184.1:379-810(-)